MPTRVFIGIVLLVGCGEPSYKHTEPPRAAVEKVPVRLEDSDGNAFSGVAILHRRFVGLVPSLTRDIVLIRRDPNSHPLSRPSFAERAASAEAAIAMLSGDELATALVFEDESVAGWRGKMKSSEIVRTLDSRPSDHSVQQGGYFWDYNYISTNQDGSSCSAPNWCASGGQAHTAAWWCHKAQMWGGQISCTGSCAALVYMKMWRGSPWPNGIQTYGTADTTQGDPDFGTPHNEWPYWDNGYNWTWFYVDQTQSGSGSAGSFVDIYCYD